MNIFLFNDILPKYIFLSFCFQMIYNGKMYDCVFKAFIFAWAIVKADIALLDLLLNYFQLHFDSISKNAKCKRIFSWYY